MPKEDQQDDTRLRAAIDKPHQLRLESEVTCLEECQTGEEEDAHFVVVAERRYPSLLLYELKALENLNLGATINPRMTLAGHENPITTIKSRMSSILSGNSSGEVLLHNLNKGLQATHFRYHRDQVNSCIWLGQARDTKTFATGCEDGNICM